MTNFISSFLFYVFILLLSNITTTSYVYAQEKENLQEEREDNMDLILQHGLDQQILIRKNRYITLPISNKVNNWEIIRNPKPTFRPFQHSIDAVKTTKNYYGSKLSAVSIEEKKNDEKYFAIIKSGVGNYLSTYLETTFLNPRFPKNRINYGFRGMHRGSLHGPIFDNKSGFYNQSLEGFADSSFASWNINLNSKFIREKYRLYGIYSILGQDETSALLEVNQYYSWKTQGIITFNRNALTGKTIEIIPSISYFSGRSEMNELTSSIILETRHQLVEEIKMNLNAQYFFSSLSIDIARYVKRHFIRFNPSVDFSLNKFDIEAGLNLNYSNSATSLSLYKSDANINVMLNLKLSYLITDLTRVHAGIHGDSVPRTLEQINSKMPYISSKTIPKHQNNFFVAYFGVHTYDLSNLFLYAEFKFTRAKNFLSFTNTMNKQENFSATYSPLGNISTLKGELRYRINASVSLNALMIYNRFDFEKMLAHLPEYEFTLGTDFDIYEKIYGRIGGKYVGNRYYTDMKQSSKHLEDIIDLYAHFDYKWNENAGIFLQLNNLLNREYQLYYLYPSKGLSFLIGGTYKF